MSFALTRLIEIHAKKEGGGGLLLEQGCQRSGVQIRCSVFHNVSVYWLPEYKERESETENQRVQLNRLIISPEPIFHTPRRGPAHGWLLYYYWCCCSSCLAGRHVWLELRLPPRNPFHSFQTGMPIFRVLLSAVMAVESLASFNPSLLPMGWLAEGMPLRSSSPHRHQFLTTLPHLPLSNVEEVPACVCVAEQRKSRATRRELLLGAWGSWLQMKDKTQDDNDKVWLFLRSASGLSVLAALLSLISFCLTNLRKADVVRLIGLLVIPSPFIQCTH